MSRIGRKPISIPEGVTVEVRDGRIFVKGSKGELSENMLPGIEVEVSEREILVTRKNDQRQTRAFHGLVRSLIENMVIGVSQGYKKTLELVGTGYRVKKSGKGLSMTLGFSHPIEVLPVEGVEFQIEGNNVIHISGINKQVVGQVAADIRAKRKPEPYKGKGVRYRGEVIRRKAGKAAKTAE